MKQKQKNSGVTRSFNDYRTHKVRKTKILVLACIVAVFALGGLTYGILKRDPSSAQSCALDARLVNPCRPLLGIWANNYPQAAGGVQGQTEYHESRLGKKVDAIHTYRANPAVLIGADEKYVLNRSDQPMLVVNYKPTTGAWATANGSNSGVNSDIDKAADQAKAIAPRKFILVLFHEPENDVSANNCTSNASGANRGSPQDYVAMWHNVRARFDAKGVTNVVWGINYMGFKNWDCLVTLLWPGNSYVDWVFYDPYAQNGTEAFDANVGRFYTNVLTAKSNATTNFLSKPWGIAEHGTTTDLTDSETAAYWNGAASAVTSNKYPNLKMYIPFDAEGGGLGDHRVGYNQAGAVSSTEQSAYNTFANAVLSYGNSTTPPPPPADTSPPSVSFSSPTTNATVSKVITISAAASDNVGVTQVDLYVDSTLVKSDKNGSDGWQTTWDSASTANGSHTLKATAFDTAGNSKTVLNTITVSNTATPTNPSIGSFTASPSTITVGSKSLLSWSYSNATSCSITPGGPSNTTATSWQTPTLTNAGTTTYTLTCKNASNATATKTVTIAVNAPVTPPSGVVLSADKTVITAGSTVVLSWVSTGATSCTLSPGGTTSSGGTGSKTVSGLTSTTTYSVSCSNTAGTTKSNSLTITVQSSPPPKPPKPTITSFTASPTTITGSGIATLSWTASNVTTNGCNLAPTPLTTAPASGQWTSPILTASASYTLTCKNSINETTSASVSIIVNAQPAPKAPDPVSPGSIPSPGMPDGQKVVTATSGQKVVNTGATDKVNSGSLVSLDVANVTDKQRQAHVKRVEYFNGAKLIYVATSQPFALNTKVLSAGTYTITERTYFDDGSISESIRSITVKERAKGAGKVMGLFVDQNGEVNKVAVAAVPASLMVTAISAYASHSIGLAMIIRRRFF